MNETLETEAIPHDEIRPCDFCKGPITPFFYVFDVSMAVVNAPNANELLGMHQFFQGKSLEMAALFSPGSREMATILNDPESRTRLYCCQDCLTKKLGCVCGAIEERNQVEKSDG